MRLGIIFIVIGVLGLLNSTGLLNDQTMRIIAPIAFIVVGAWLMIRKGCCWKSGLWGARNCGCHDDCDHKNNVCEVKSK